MALSKPQTFQPYTAEEESFKAFRHRFEYNMEAMGVPMRRWGGIIQGYLKGNPQQLYTTTLAQNNFKTVAYTGFMELLEETYTSKYTAERYRMQLAKA